MTAQRFNFTTTLTLLFRTKEVAETQFGIEAETNLCSDIP